MGSSASTRRNRRRNDDAQVTAPPHGTQGPLAPYTHVPQQHFAANPGHHGASSSYPNTYPQQQLAVDLPPRAYPQQYPSTNVQASGLPSVKHASQQNSANSLSQRAATTVRNLINLKKNTLTVTPKPDEPHMLQISFKFDAVQACSVSIFLMAQETKQTGRITAKSTAGTHVLYDAGMNLKFPPADATELDHCIDTRRHSLEEMHSANTETNTFPLIIRLETLAQPDSEEHSLTEQEPGAILQPWTQSQTTYALLGKDGGDVQVVKQKIWVGGNLYELQEIFGLVEAASSSDDASHSTVDCVVCLSSPKDTLVVPCRHLCMCHECARTLMRRTNKCPMCRLPISSVLQIQTQSRVRAAGDDTAS